MNNDYFWHKVKEKFVFDFSDNQKEVLSSFIDFLFSNNSNSLFLLKGYAGTGKTKLASAIINALNEIYAKFILLAPTGRAAKVFSSYSNFPAFTIHKQIYRQKNNTDTMYSFALGYNKDVSTLFFIDEASMIGESGGDLSFGSGNLLDDIMQYVYNGKNNRLVLIGDEAQLPPVGTDLSPALSKDYLETAYDLTVYEVEMSEVMRQTENSGILYNATTIRSMIGSSSNNLIFKLNKFPDIFKIGGSELLELLEDSYSHYGIEETIVLCRTNQRANKFNEGIRRTILYREDDFSSGDRVMIVKNNYFCAKDYEDIDFIANGEIATIKRIGRRSDYYDFHFIKADILLDGNNQEITSQILMDTLTSDSSALPYEENKKLFYNIQKDYPEIKSRRKLIDKVKENEYFNALQMKFAYAVTCHKAQGGQWDAVFVDQGWLTETMMDDNFWRWLYTAVTRARKKLYLLNFNKVFFEQ